MSTRLEDALKARKPEDYRVCSLDGEAVDFWKYGDASGTSHSGHPEKLEVPTPEEFRELVSDCVKFDCDKDDGW